MASAKVFGRNYDGQQTQSMNDLVLKKMPPNQYQVRAELEAMALRDLLGTPGGESEELTGCRVRVPYLLVRLATRPLVRVDIRNCLKRFKGETNRELEMILSNEEDAA